MLTTLFLTFLASFAHAADKSAVTPAPSHKTYWLVLGTSEYAAMQNPADPKILPGVEGATADCNGIAVDLATFGYPAEQLTALCGEKFLRGDLVAAVKGLNGRVTSGDTLVVVMQGHGGMDEKNDPGQVYWQAFDGSFAVEGDDTGASYTFTGLTPRVLEASIRRAVPEGTIVLFLTDTARGGVFEEVNLSGPSADDFATLNNTTLAYSPMKGSGQPGVLRNMLRACLRREIAFADDGMVNVLEAGTCLTAEADKAHVPLSAMVPVAIDQTRALLWFPPKPAALMSTIDLGHSKTRTLTAVQRWGGLGVGVAAAAVGTVNYFEAKKTFDQVEALDYNIPSSMEDEVHAYEGTIVSAYVLWGIGAAGGISFTTSFIHLTPTPNGVAVSGTFK